MVIFGTNEDKLSGLLLPMRPILYGRFRKTLKVDHAIECVGGDASQKAIDQMIDIIRSEGTIALQQYPEYAVPINTRMVLEKGFIFMATEVEEPILRKQLNYIRNIQKFSVTSAIS